MVVPFICRRVDDRCRITLVSIKYLLPLLLHNDVMVSASVAHSHSITRSFAASGGGRERSIEERKGLFCDLRCAE